MHLHIGMKYSLVCQLIEVTVGFLAGVDMLGLQSPLCWWLTGQAGGGHHSVTCRAGDLGFVCLASDPPGCAESVIHSILKSICKKQ